MTDQQPLALTQHEIEALKTRHNLADAPTRQQRPPRRRKIVDALPELWYDAARKRQADLEDHFKEVFFKLHGQRSVLSDSTMLSYAASIRVPESTCPN